MLSFLSTLSCDKPGEVSGFFKQLTGSWQRINEQEGLETFEIWEESKGKITGKAYTLKEKDTVFKENLAIIEKDDTWYLEVKAPNEAMVPFKITSFSHTDVTAENPDNEYPKKVSYNFKNDTLTATISGGGPTVPYTFVRLHER